MADKNNSLYDFNEVADFINLKTGIDKDVIFQVLEADVEYMKHVLKGEK